MTPVVKGNWHGSLGSSAGNPGSGSWLGSLVLLCVTVFGRECPRFTYVSGSGLGLLEELGHLAFSMRPFHTARWGVLIAWWSPGKLVINGSRLPSEWALQEAGARSRRCLKAWAGNWHSMTSLWSKQSQKPSRFKGGRPRPQFWVGAGIKTRDYFNSSELDTQHFSL